jgi:hypothetical protein
MALSNANLTNAFGQGIFGVAMGVIAWSGARERTSWKAMIAATALLVAAAAGFLLMLRRRGRKMFTLVLAARVLAWAALTAVELLSPMEMRLNLAAAPAFACLGAYALGTLASRSWLGKVVAEPPRS